MSLPTFLAVPLLVLPNDCSKTSLVKYFCKSLGKYLAITSMPSKNVSSLAVSNIDLFISGPSVPFINTPFLNLPSLRLETSVERIDLPVVPSMILFISTPLGAPFASAILISALSEVLNVGASALPCSALLVASFITSFSSLSTLSTNVGFVFLKASLSFK